MLSRSSAVVVRAYNDPVLKQRPAQRVPPTPHWFWKKPPSGLQSAFERQRFPQGLDGGFGGTAEAQ